MRARWRKSSGQCVRLGAMESGGILESVSITGTAIDQDHQDQVNDSEAVADTGPNRRNRRPSTRYAGKERATGQYK